MNHCVDCAMDGEGWHSICSDGKPRCYLHKKIFDGLIGTHDPRNKTKRDMSKFNPKLNTTITPEFRKRLSVLVDSSSMASVDQAANVQMGTTYRIIKLGYDSMTPVNYEKLSAFVSSGKLVQSKKIPINDELIRKAEKVFRAHRVKDCFSETGMYRQTLQKIMTRNNKNVKADTVTKIQEAYNRL